MPEAPDIIKELVERYGSNRDQYMSAAYNEEQTRAEFINPFFEALGWDVSNKSGNSPAYMDVVFEGTIRVDGNANAPDYTFRVGQTRKFFVEAKKPKERIEFQQDHARQIRRYSWTAKLPLGILTNFHELAVYDCRLPPKPNDRASHARLKYIKYTEYLERWDEIAAIFSKEAVWKGAFDKYAKTDKGKRGTAEVDQEFLKQIEEWRAVLARNMKLRNPQLEVRELNYAVQNTIDRIVFLRMCEDRGIEPQSQLLGATNGPNVYGRLIDLYLSADAKYNSGLFHFSDEKGRPEAPDTLTTHLKIDDKVLKDMISGLYYPKSPYEFSVIGADILGSVYEQFLGKVIRLTPAHTAVVEEKPEVKKAGGVYYTPTYVVDYIVQNTVGKLCEGKTPKQVAKLRIVDPACGSGSFLINAYAWLLNWHLDYYVKNDPKKYKKEVYQIGESEWRLTTKEKKRILVSNIYGVDIDGQAVEVTKLSLLLKVLEGESRDTLDSSLTMFHERALPDLSANIKCGNSLIGTDFDASALSDEEERRINPFDWDEEFSSIMSNGGFDVVIGNPPYVLLEGDFRDDKQMAYFKSRYESASYKVDTYHLFIEKGVRLSASGGICSMITPANFLTNNHLAGLRKFILDNTNIDHILVLDGGVFRKISVDNAIFVFTHSTKPQQSFPVVHANPAISSLSQTARIDVSVSTAKEDKHVLFTGTSNSASACLWKQITERSVPLGTLAYVNFGKQLRDRGKYTADVIQLSQPSDAPSGYKPCYTGHDVERYRLSWSGLACLDDEIARSGGCWDPDKQNANNKLLTRQIGRYPEYALDERGYQCLNTMFMVNLRAGSPSERYLLGILNSSLLRAFWLDRFYDQRRTFPKIKGTYLKQLPVHVPDLADTNGRVQHDKLVELVDRMLDLHKKQDAATIPGDKTQIERQIATTDREIDKLVYELYDLTDEEIRIVEENVPKHEGRETA